MSRALSKRLFNITQACVLTTCLMAAPYGSALSITGSYSHADAPADADLTDVLGVLNIAAGLWALNIDADHTLNLLFGWDDALPTGTLGVATNFFANTSTQRIVQASINFNPDRTDWFIDPTPLDDTEYEPFSIVFQDLGQGPVNIGITADSIAGGPADNLFDLLTVALHEIGHTVGLANLPGFNDFTTPTLTIDPRLPFGGSDVPTTLNGGGHLTLPSALMFESLGSGERKFMSEVDVLAATQLGNLIIVPSPAAAGAGIVALCVLASARRRRAAA